MLTMRTARWAVLLAGWILFMTSLVSPAIGLSSGWVPGWLCYVWLFIPFFPAHLCFLASPLYATCRFEGSFGWLGRLPALLLLACWIPPRLWDGQFTPLIGYYEFAAAYTLAFITIQIGGLRQAKASRVRGFPVIAPHTINDQHSNPAARLGRDR